jgi:hypothetical protein
MNLLDILFGKNPKARQANRQPEPVVASETTLEISKACRQLDFLDKSYNLTLWTGSEHRTRYEHDLRLMRHFGDLERVTLQLIDKAGKVCGEFSVIFARKGQRSAQAKVDSGGIECPVIDRAAVAGKRIIIDRRGNDAAYRAHLKLNWSQAEKLDQRAGDTYASEHAARITGGRQAGEFFVAAGNRHSLIVTHAVPNGPYCFARDLTMNRDGIFLLRKHAGQDVPFEVGAKLTAVIVATPKGLQARAVRLAA